MLTLEYGLVRERKTVLLGKLKEQFSKYFNFLTSGSLAEAIAYEQAGANFRGEFNPRDAGTSTNSDPQNQRDRVNNLLGVRSDPIKARVFEIFLDSNEGASPAISSPPTSTAAPGTFEFNDSALRSFQIRSIKNKIADLLTSTDSSRNREQNINSIRQCVRMHYSEIMRDRSSSENETNEGILLADLDLIGFRAEEDNLKRRISAFEVLHPLMIPGEKNAELLTVFFNGMPTIELHRSTPILNLKFYSSRKVEQDGKLGAITLHKFLEGAVSIPQTGSNPLRAINLANQITASATPFFNDPEGSVQNFSVVGLELFRAPQTLQNIQATKNKENYLAPVIDPMRPLASIKSLEIEVRATVGLIQNKTAKLEIILHDRSRLGEFADFVKPDRYGQSFVDIEYGWNHPDGIEIDPNRVANPYAQLLNLLRSQDHYGISTSNFSFDEVGQVNITLNLYTRGSAETTEVTISESSPDIRENVRKLADFSRRVNELSARIFRTDASPASQNNSSGRRTEIRGQQMLTAAGDAQNMLVINDQLLRSLGELRENLNGIGRDRNSPQASNANELLRILEEMIGPPTNTSTQNGRQRQNQQLGDNSTIGRIQESINGSIRRTLENINPNVGASTDSFANDVFLKNVSPSVKTKLANSSRRPSTRSEYETQNSAQYDVFGDQNPPTTRAPNNPETNSRSANPNANRRENIVMRQSIVSLGTILVTFVAKRLASLTDPLTGVYKFSEVQLYCYMFNNKAGMMSRCNISQFPIYLDFFAREYSRIRLENSSRAVNFTINDFMNFISNRMIDDPMNPAYGIANLYKTYSSPRNQNNQSQGEDQRQYDTSVVTHRTMTDDEFNRCVEIAMLDRETGNVSGSPNFIMPQVTYEFEAVPDARDLTKTILKIHVFDRTCSSNSSLRELLDLSTNDQMSTLSAFPSDQDQANQLVENAAEDQMQTNSTVRSRGRSRRQIANNSTVSESQRANIIQSTGELMRRNWLEIHRAIVADATEDKPGRGRLITEVEPRTEPPTYVFVGGPQSLKNMVMKYMPHIIYGCMGSTVKNATINSKQDPLNASLNMTRNFNADPILPNGQQLGGVPLQVYPIDLSITSLGCPFLRLGQEIFVDFNTNTTIDNIYYINGITHRFEAGTFESNIKLIANDAFGQYRNFISQLRHGRNIIQRATNNQNTVSEPESSQTPPRR